MGYKKVPTVYTLDKIKGSEGLEIRIKGLRVGKLRRLVRILESDERSLTEVLDEALDLISANAVSWNVTDEDDQPIELSREGLEELELSELMEILGAWTDKLTSVGDDLGKDSTSGESFPGRPLTMEAL